MQPQGSGFERETIDCMFCDLSYYVPSDLVLHMSSLHLDEIPAKYRTSKNDILEWCKNKLKETYL